MTSKYPDALDPLQELAPGDAIEVFYRSRLVHRGPVAETSPERGLVWILDTLSGCRCLIDTAEVDVVRLPVHYREVRTLDTWRRPAGPRGSGF